MNDISTAADLGTFHFTGGEDRKGVNLRVGGIGAAKFTCPDAPFLRRFAAIGMAGDGPFAARMWVSSTPDGPAIGPEKHFSNTGNSLKISDTQPAPRVLNFFGKTITFPAEQVVDLEQGGTYYINVQALGADDGVASFWLSLM